MENFLSRAGLDMPYEEHVGLLDHREDIYEQIS
jgi:hypothetical protein